MAPFNLKICLFAAMALCVTTSGCAGKGASTAPIAPSESTGADAGGGITNSGSAGASGGSSAGNAGNSSSAPPGA